MADAKVAEGKVVPTNNEKYGCITDLAMQQAETSAKTSAINDKPANTKTTEKE